MPAPSPRALFSCTSELAASCRGLRLHVERSKLATIEELAGFWPDESTAPDSGEPWPWVYAYGQLQRLMGRGAGSAGGDDAAGAEQAALAVLQEEPEVVVLSGGARLRVYPKGIWCITWMDVRDGYLGWLRDRRLAWEAAVADGSAPADGPVGPAEIVARCRAEEVRQLATMAAQACARGPRLRRRIPAATVERFGSLSPADLLRIHQAYLRVNSLRLQIARALVEPTSKGATERPSWAVLQARAADRWRSDPRSIGDDRSLAALLLTVELAAPAAASSDIEDALS